MKAMQTRRQPRRASKSMDETYYSEAAPGPADRRLAGLKRSAAEAGLPDATSTPGASPNKRVRRGEPLRGYSPPTPVKGDWKTNPATRIATIRQFRPTCDRLPCFRDEPRYVTPLAGSIVARLRETEHSSMVPLEWAESLADEPHAGTRRPQIGARVRCVMVDWLHRVHTSFGLKREVFYLTVQLVDRYCAEAAAEGNPVKREDYTLTGITCMWTAAKYHEIYAPSMEDFVAIANGSYTSEEMKQHERRILVALDFELTLPTVGLFLQRFLLVARPLLTGDRQERAVHIAEYLAEHIVHRPGHLAHAPSLVAATAVYLGMVMTGSGEWCEELEKCSGYTVQDLNEGPIDAMQDAFRRPKDSLATLVESVYAKYAREERGSVARLMPLTE